MDGSSEPESGCQSRRINSSRIETRGREKKESNEQRKKRNIKRNRGVQLHAYAVL
jgi:hypothetical protein